MSKTMTLPTKVLNWTDYSLDGRCFLKAIRSFFTGFTIIDAVLAIGFTGLLAYAVYLVFPPNGWMIGVAAALLLLFIAKRRRDQFIKKS